MEQNVPKGEWVVYILQSKPRPNRTYVGVTNDLKKRLRQHNGELVGGASATKTTRPWQVMSIVRGFQGNKSVAMRCEWFMKVKHYKGVMPETCRNGVQRRMFLLQYAIDKCSDVAKLTVEQINQNENENQIVVDVTL